MTELKQYQLDLEIIEAREDELTEAELVRRFFEDTQDEFMYTQFEDDLFFQEVGF